MDFCNKWVDLFCWIVQFCCNLIRPNYQLHYIVVWYEQYTCTRITYLPYLTSWFLNFCLWMWHNYVTCCLSQWNTCTANFQVLVNSGCKGESHAIKSIADFWILLSGWLTLLMLLQLEVARKNAVQTDTTLVLQLVTHSLHGRITTAVELTHPNIYLRVFE